MKKVTLSQKGIRCSKHMKQMILNAERELNAEGVKQLALVNLSSAISLIESWGWSNDRIKELFKKEEELIEQCSKDKNLSLISMFDDECDIELTNGEGISYKDYSFLNIEKDRNEYSAPQMLQMRLNEKQWLGAMFTAAMGLALYRLEGWDSDEIEKLLQKIQEVKEACGYDIKTMTAYAKDKAGFDISDFTIAA